MKNDIAIYIPNYNGEDFLDKVAIPEGVDCVVMDNCSSDNSEDICKKRGFLFVSNTEFVDRVDNWIRCIRHFRKSSYKWMKWLMNGDELSDDSMEIMQKATEMYSNSSIIIFDYDIIGANKAGNKTLNKAWEGIWSYEQILDRILLVGNVFGAALGVMISQNANFEKLKNSDLEWAGDTYMHLQLCENRECAYVPCKIGTFVAKNRKTFTKKNKSIYAIMEEIELLRRTLKLKEKYFYTANNDYQAFVMMKMKQCIENNTHGLPNIVGIQIMVIRCIVRNIIGGIRKN